MMTDKALAELIAARLFTDGTGQVALRLKLVSMHGKDMGGWCIQAIIDQIEKALKEHRQ